MIPNTLPIRNGNGDSSSLRAQRVMDSEEDVLALIRTANALFLQGDIDAARDKFREAVELLAQLYRNYFLYLALRSLPLGLKHLAEDITQDVNLAMCQSLPRFDENRNVKLKTWLIGIFYNCRVDALKRYNQPLGPYILDSNVDITRACRTKEINVKT